MLKERLGVRRVQRKKYILLIYLWFPVLQIIEGSGDGERYVRTYIRICNKILWAPISRYSKNQSVVALSSTEAKFIVIADCRMELLYIKYIVEEAKLVIKLHVDNQNAM